MQSQDHNVVIVHISHAGNVPVQIINASEYLPGLLTLLLITLNSFHNDLKQELGYWPDQDGQARKVAMSEEKVMI